MNTHHDPELEAWADRELKSLPLLSAPSSLAPRVMAMVAARAAEPWYRRAWQTWPMPLRTVALMALMVFFAALCLGGWKASQVAGLDGTPQPGGIFSIVNVLWGTLAALGNAFAQVVRHLGTGVVLAVVTVVVAGYAMLLGLGSACYRLAYARR